MPDAVTASTEGDGSSPRRPLVVPRGHRRGSSASLPVDQLLLPVIRSASRGLALITAPAGGGKSTALQHLRAVIPADVAVRFFDVDQIAEARRVAATGWVVLAATDPQLVDGVVEVVQLSRWTLDDCLEYLHAKHPVDCASVLSRLSRDKSFEIMEGSPQLLTLVMDLMAGDASLDCGRGILRKQIRSILPSGDALDRLVIDGLSLAPLNSEQWRWWRHQAVQHICIASWLVQRLSDGVVSNQLHSMDEAAHLIPDIAAALHDQPAARDCLLRFIDKERRSAAVPMVASILLAQESNWKPADARGLLLAKAQLSGARWAGVDLTGALLMGANLSDADLSDANLKVANAEHSDLTHANLRGATLKNARFVGANLTSADLSETSASKADFSEANLESANLHNAVLCEAKFANADLSGVSAQSADFTSASFSGVCLNRTDFTRAKFNSARFVRVDFSESNLSAACFGGAQLVSCNFEWLEMAGAVFTDANLAGSLLTGTRISGGDFRRANLAGTGLAEIHWENADLRNADLSEASFHMGSTRSGLVGSTIAGEGSRTGFYTDDFNDQTYKPPEEIRKACLFGANLLGAVVEHTDFYLVDLREAIYSASQAQHFAKSGAILEGPDS